MAMLTNGLGKEQSSAIGVLPAGPGAVLPR